MWGGAFTLVDHTVGVRVLDILRFYMWHGTKGINEAGSGGVFYPSDHTLAVVNHVGTSEFVTTDLLLRICPLCLLMLVTVMLTAEVT